MANDKKAERLKVKYEKEVECKIKYVKMYRKKFKTKNQAAKKQKHAMEKTNKTYKRKQIKWQTKQL